MLKVVTGWIICCWLAPVVLAVELRLDGEFVQGGLVVGHTEPGNQVVFNQQTLPVSEQGIFVLGFDRDAPASARLEVVSPSGQRLERLITVKSRDYRLQRIEGIASAIMQPSPEALQRIGEEAAQVRAARARHLPRLDFLQPFRWPLKGPITGVYGSQRIYNGVPKRPHYGVDVAAPTGTPVSTPAPGVVTLAHPDMFYSGGTVIIDHGHGVSSTLMHLSEVHVKAGDDVAPGDIIGAVGAGGRATGPHLDWRMNWRDARVDPQRLVPPLPESQPVEVVVFPHVLVEFKRGQSRN